MIYKQNVTNKKIIKIISLATFILITVILISKYYTSYQVHKIYQNTENIYEHPLRVSNQSLHVVSNLYEMHRDMKDVVLYPKEEELNKLIEKVNEIEKEVYLNLDIIKKYILGDKGRELESQMRIMFNNWKPIRDEVIELIKNKQYNKAIAITKGKGAQHVVKMEVASIKLYSYAQDKATFFKDESLTIFKSFEKFTDITTILFLLVFIFIAYYIINKLSDYLKELEENKKILETLIDEAPNPIIIYNEKGKVFLINKVWEELTGYSHKEIDTIEKWTKKAYGKEHAVVKEVIQELFEHQQRVDNGEYTITTKDGNKIIWSFSSTPIGIIDNEKTIISSAMDITDLRNKDRLLLVQARHAAMGEMLSNIAHQWRQPLSLISSITTGMQMQYLVKEFDIEDFNKNMKKINSTVQYLSGTIDDFRNFFIPNKEKTSFKINDVFEKTFSLISSQFKNKNITIIEAIPDLEVTGFENEFLQVIINILNNSRDALLLNETEERYIFIDVYEEEENIVICIKDNAGGIKKEIIEKIFDPYFTTKHQSQGTGIGLYMSEEIIEKHMNGKIEVSNESYTYAEKNYIGAEFKIYLPKRKEKAEN